MSTPAIEINGLPALTSIDDAYMCLPIEQGFNWAESLAGLPNAEYYLVVFRSRHRADADVARLTELDEHAQWAARATPGFIHYFMGVPNAGRDCLSFCLWEGQPQARAASRHDAHKTAEKEADRMFDYFHLERYLVQKGEAGVPIFRRL